MALKFAEIFKARNDRKNGTFTRSNSSTEDKKRLGWKLLMVRLLNYFSVFVLK